MYLNSFKKFFPWRTVSQVFYTSNTLSVSLCRSVQIGHWYRKFRNSKQRNSTRKSCFKIPLLMKDQSCTRDCSKQTREFPQLQNIDLNLLKITLQFSLFAKPAPLSLLICFKGCMRFFVTRFLIDRCQIVTDTCQKMFQSLFGGLLNYLFHYPNINISVRPLFYLHLFNLFQLPFYQLKICSVQGRFCHSYSPN